MPTRLLACLLLAATASPAAASTTVTGGTVINQIWTPAGSPYIVEGDITVPSGASLTIQPGVVVQVASGDLEASGSDTGRVEIIVAGTLNAAGTAGNGIVFEALNGTAPNSWYGIEVSGAATIAYATVEHAVYGIYSTSATGLSVTNTSLLNHGTAGVYIANGTPTLDHLTISNANTSSTNYGLYTAGTSTITNSAIYGCYFGVYATGPTTTLNYATIYANRYGVQSNSAGSTTTVKNSIVTNQLSYGLLNGGGTVTTSNSDLWQNGFGNSGSIGGLFTSINPLYANAPTSFALTSNSPGRFGSDAGTDIGAAPYAGVATPGLYGTLWINTHLTTAGSPYTVAGDLATGPGITLTVDPGVTVSATSGDLMAAGADTGRVEIDALLNAIGTKASPTTWTCANKTPNCWYGLGLATGSTLSRFVEDSAVYGVSQYAGPGTIDHGTLSNNGTAGLYVGASMTETVDGLTITNNNTSSTNYGVYVTAGTITLTNSIAYGNYFGAYLNGTVALNSVTFNANRYGVQSNSSGSAISLRNAIVTNQLSYGLLNGGGTVTANYSDLWQNGFGNSGSIGGGVGNISSNPQYVGAPNFHLQGTSVCIDIGDATGAPNHDRDDVTRPLDGDGINGAGYDLGAYEFLLTSACGDGVIESGETCDDGAQNGTYNHCNATCNGLGPSCGDGSVNGPETCDDGAQNGTYNHCNATCSGLGPRCGDGSVNGPETCDDGGQNGTYGHCNATCNGAGPRCGDGAVNGAETCDDGAQNGTYGHCNASCTGQGPRCGDGALNGSETCDDGSNNGSYGYCNSTCNGPGPRCGDGTKNGPEACDDGAQNGNYGHCDATCSGPGPRCGDGVKNGPEVCDDGLADGTYGSCNATCSGAGPHCGDGIKNGPEVCDDGAQNGAYNHCNGACSAAGPRCGDGVVNGPEQCDDGLGNGVPGDACGAGCLFASTDMAEPKDLGEDLSPGGGEDLGLSGGEDLASRDDLAGRADLAGAISPTRAAAGRTISPSAATVRSRDPRTTWRSRVTPGCRTRTPPRTRAAAATWARTAPARAAPGSRSRCSRSGSPASAAASEAERGAAPPRFPRRAVQDRHLLAVRDTRFRAVSGLMPSFETAINELERQGVDGFIVAERHRSRYDGSA